MLYNQKKNMRFVLPVEINFNKGGHCMNFCDKCGTLLKEG